MIDSTYIDARRGLDETARCIEQMETRYQMLRQENARLRQTIDKNVAAIAVAAWPLDTACGRAIEKTGLNDSLLITADAGLTQGDVRLALKAIRKALDDLLSPSVSPPSPALGKAETP